MDGTPGFVQGEVLCRRIRDPYCIAQVQQIAAEKRKSTIDKITWGQDVDQCNVRNAALGPEHCQS